MKSKIISILSLLFLIASCDDPMNDTPYVDTVVVAAYLYAGEPVSNVKVTRLIPFNADTSEVFYINDAEVDSIHRDNSYR